jgi:hypothetical protein
MQISSFIPRSGEVMSYIDSSRTLEAHLEYHYNIRSESTSYALSDPSLISASRPDNPRKIITPQGLSFRHLDDGTLMLYWKDHLKIDPFTTKYHIYTVDADGKADKEVSGSPIDVHQNFWIQKEGPMASNGYVLQAEDAWGNLSLPTFDLNPMVKAQLSTPGMILVKLVGNGYRLSWGLPEDARIKSIELYEIESSGNESLVKSFSPIISSYDIPLLESDQVKSYFLKYKWTDGTDSENGDIVIISR